MSDHLAQAIAETEAVLDQYVTQGGIDPDTIYGIYSKPLGRVVFLSVDNLRTLIEAARA